MTLELDQEWFDKQTAFYEEAYLRGRNPREQSGFGRDERDWERFRKPIIAAIHKSGSFLDIGCASGLLMQDVAKWADQRGYTLEPYGLEISNKIAELARIRLPEWKERIFVGNAFDWAPPFRFDYVRTELVYVPRSRRQYFTERLLSSIVAPEGVLILCSYGSSRTVGQRAETLTDELHAWGIEIAGVEDLISPDHNFIITRAVWVRAGL